MRKNRHRIFVAGNLYIVNYSDRVSVLSQGKAIISTLCKLMEEVLRNSGAMQVRDMSQIFAVRFP